MVAQDTGSAIIGPARADIYFGAGADAGRVAGRLKNPANFVMLLPKSLDPMSAWQDRAVTGSAAESCIRLRALEAEAKSDTPHACPASSSLSLPPMKKRPPILTTPSPIRRKRSLSGEELALWESVAKQVKPLRKKPPAGTEPTRRSRLRACRGRTSSAADAKARWQRCRKKWLWLPQPRRRLRRSDVVSVHNYHGGEKISMRGSIFTA